MAIEHKCKITVLECKCFNDYQEKYLADPQSGLRTTGDGYYESCIRGFEGILLEITV